MKKKLALIIFIISFIAISSFIFYFIFQDIMDKRQKKAEEFIPENINIDEIDNDLEYVVSLPEYDILFTGLIGADKETTFYDIVKFNESSIEDFNATGIRTDDELVNVDFTGISINEVLKNISIDDDANYVIAYATDLYASVFTIDEFTGGDVYLTWKRSGNYFNPTEDGVLKIVQDNGPTNKWIKNPVLFDFVKDFNDLVPTADRLDPDAIDFISEQNFFNLYIGGIPDIDIKDWELEVTGLVSDPITLDYDEILSMPQSSVFATLETISNPQGGMSIGNAVWTGVPFKYIMDLVGPEEKVIKVAFFCEDGYSTGLTPEELTEEGVILAYKMNGRFLSPNHGFPLKLVVPQKYGMKWPKWVNKINFVDNDYKGYWESRGWSDYAGRDRPEERYD